MQGRTRRCGTAAFVIMATLGVACGKESKPAAPATVEPAAPAASAAPAGAGKVIVVEAYSDAQGNYFKPAEITAKSGDILRFTLKAGVHNVNFLADSNPGKAGLPKASDMLQLPDQTYDVVVTFAKGKYYFQCDPHAALGMKGHLQVE